MAKVAKILVIVMGIEDVLVSLAYLWAREYRWALYWFAAAVIAFCLAR